MHQGGRWVVKMETWSRVPGWNGEDIEDIMKAYGHIPSEAVEVLEMGEPAALALQIHVG